MRLNNAAPGAAAVILLLLTAGCKGRTMQNMEPNGDTVEVLITPQASPEAELP